MCSWLSEILRGLFSNSILQKPLNISVKEPRWGARKIPGLTRKGSQNCVILLSFLPLISSTHCNLVSGIVLNILQKIIWRKSPMTPILLIQGIFVSLCLEHSTGLWTHSPPWPPDFPWAFSSFSLHWGGPSASQPGSARRPQGQAEPSARLPPCSVLQALLLPGPGLILLEVSPSCSPKSLVGLWKCISAWDTLTEIQIYLVSVGIFLGWWGGGWGWYFPLIFFF